jgi:hypothetical protein
MPYKPVLLLIVKNFQPVTVALSVRLPDFPAAMASAEKIPR